jgi:hypothetical protein
MMRHQIALLLHRLAGRIDDHQPVRFGIYMPTASTGCSNSNVSVSWSVDDAQ